MHLTPREMQIVRLLADAYRPKVVAESLGLSQGTLKVYLSRLYQRMPACERCAGPCTCAILIRLIRLYDGGNLVEQQAAVGAKPGSHHSHHVMRTKERPQQQQPEPAAEPPAPAADAPAPSAAGLTGDVSYQARKAADDERWNRIFTERFADPAYYSGVRKPSMNSPLSSI